MFRQWKILFGFHDTPCLGGKECQFHQVSRAVTPLTITVRGEFFDGGPTYLFLPKKDIMKALSTIMCEDLNIVFSKGCNIQRFLKHIRLSTAASRRLSIASESALRSSILQRGLMRYVVVIRRVCGLF